MASAIVLPDFIADSVSKTYTRPNSRGRYRGRSETLIRSSSGVLNRCFTVTFSLSHQPSLTYKQTPPPLDLSRCSFDLTYTVFQNLVMKHSLIFYRYARFLSELIGRNFLSRGSYYTLLLIHKN